MTSLDVVRDLFAAFRAQDRTRTEELLAEDFRFTSPQDDRIDKAAYLERCFPRAHRFLTQELLQVVPGEGRDVFVLYEYVLRGSGERYRNAEVLTVRDDRVAETQVFFGGRITAAG